MATGDLEKAVKDELQSVEPDHGAGLDVGLVVLQEFIEQLLDLVAEPHAGDIGDGKHRARGLGADVLRALGHDIPDIRSMGHIGEIHVKDRLSFVFKLLCAGHTIDDVGYLF